MGSEKKERENVGKEVKGERGEKRERKLTESKRTTSKIILASSPRCSVLLSSAQVEFYSFIKITSVFHRLASLVLSLK